MGVLGKVKNKFSTSPMLKNITKISSGTLLGQLVSLVTLPIFTRIYGATVIGYWTLFTSVAFIVNSFSDFFLIFLNYLKYVSGLTALPSL